MSRKLLFLLFLLSPFALLASSHGDFSKSKGTEQPVIVSLLPSPEQDDVSRDAKIEVTFAVPIKPASVRKKSIKLSLISFGGNERICHKNEKENKKHSKSEPKAHEKEKFRPAHSNGHIKGTIGYDDAEYKVTFTPDAPLEPGTYEVEIKSLKADKAHKKTKIKEIKYRFVVAPETLQSITITPDPVDVKEGASVALQAVGHYDNGAEKNLTTQVVWSTDADATAQVDSNGTLKALSEGSAVVSAAFGNITGNAALIVYKEINGHRLPPESDPVVNNATLLGIDTNDNGVRDDVERWIYETYKDKHPIHIDIAMQGARGFKLILEHAEKAKEIHDMATAYIDCESYYDNYAKYFNDPILVTEEVSTEYFRRHIYFNTEEREARYIKYDELLSGDSYSLPKIENLKSLCDFNTSKYEE